MSTKMSEGFQLVHDIFRLKWIPEIIDSIASNKNRYTDIAESIEYISNTELNRKLAMLQERDVIIKEVIDGKEGYYLTDFGNDLNHVFNHFIEMSDKYVEGNLDIDFV
jgi:DNA-binding HxlR family transcriptional regulator